MSWKVAAMAFLTALILAPAATAHVSATASNPDLVIASSGSSDVGFNATTECAELVADPEVLAGIVAASGDYEVTLTVGYPQGATGPESVKVTLDATECLGSDPSSAVATGTGTVPVTVGTTTPGRVTLDLDLTSGDETSQVPFQVDYRKGYMFMVDQTFPLDVADGPVSWNATIHVTPNADTMVMTQVTEKTQFGTLEGLFAFKNIRDLTEDQLANGVLIPITFTYTPTATGWTNDTVSFKTWSHWMDDGSMKTDDQVVTWTFHNTAVTPKDESNSTPGVGLPVVAVALVGAALVAARRRD